LSNDLRLNKDDPIYVAGSFFGLEIENALIRSGLNLLSHVPPTDPYLNRKALARFNAPSLLLEFDRCLAMGVLENTDLVVETRDRQFRDTHYFALDTAPSLRAIATHRDAARRAFRRIRQARVVVISLGLNEMWFDPDTGYALNSWSDDALLSRKPKLDFRMLTVDQNVSALERIHAILTRELPSGFQMVIAASPQKLHAGFTGRDVLIATPSSKSILRTAVTRFAAQHPNVHVLPTLEMSVCADARRPYEMPEDEIFKAVA
jgi:hypothetical protein